MAQGRHRRCLGRAEGRQDRNTFSAHTDRQCIKPLPQMRRQCRAGIEDDVELFEHVPRKRLVRFERRQNGVEAARHVVEQRRLDLAHVLERDLELSRHRLTGIDPHRAAMPHHLIEIKIGAEGVIPRQPVDDHRRLFGEEWPRGVDGNAVGAHHALGVDNTLRHAGRTGRQQDLRNAVGPNFRITALDRGGGRLSNQIVERDRLRPVLVRYIADQIAVEADCLKRARKRRDRRHVDQARREQGYDVLEFGEVLRHQ